MSRSDYRSRTDGAVGPGTRRRSASPRTHHALKASHSTAVRLPGTAGTTFITTIATLTTAPSAAILMPSRLPLRRASAMKARQAAHQPIAPTAAPTSLMGTRTASPRNAAAPVRIVTSAIASAGVPNLGFTAPSAGGTNRRRPSAYTSRVAATKFPLNTLNNDKTAPARMSRAIHGEPNARANTASVPRWWATRSVHGYTHATTATTTTL